jgi:hypothetical protein
MNMDIGSALQKFPKVIQSILIDAQILFSAEKELINQGRVELMERSIIITEECLDKIKEELEQVKKQLHTSEKIDG